MMELINELYKVRSRLKQGRGGSAEYSSSIAHHALALVHHIAPVCMWHGLSGKLSTPGPEMTRLGRELECNRRGTGNRQAPCHYRGAKDTEQAWWRRRFSDMNVKRFIVGVTIRKVIYVSNMIVNIIVAAG
jgi:leucyl-tRNA synthetase